MKYISWLLLLLILGFSSAFDLGDSLVIGEHQGIVELPTITFSTEQTTSFDLFIKNNDDFIFHDPQAVLIKNIPTSGTLSSDNKKITFIGNFSGSIIVSGLKIRSYSRNIRDARIGLIVNNNTFYSTNYIDQVRDGSNWDRLEPLPVKNIQHSISGSSLFISWDPSPDLDIVRTSLQIYKNGVYYRFIELSPSALTYTLDLADLLDSNIQIDIAARDVYYSSPVSVIRVDPNVIQNVILEEEILYYKPQIDSKLLSAIIIRLDTNLSSLGKVDQSSIAQRNEFIILMEKVLLKDISIAELIVGLKEYKDMLSILKI